LHSSELFTKLIVNLSVLVEVLLLSFHSLSFDLDLSCLLLLLYSAHLLLHQIELLQLVKFLNFVIGDRRSQLHTLALSFERALFWREKTCFLVPFVDRVIVNNGDCVLMELTSLRFLDVVAKTVQLLVPFPIEVIACWLFRIASRFLSIKWSTRLR
jgi:hypothetical protein